MADTIIKRPKAKTTKPKKISYAGKEPTGDFHHEILNITLPNAEQINDFQYLQNISDEQMKEFLFLLKHMYMDLEAFNSLHLEENERKAWIKAILDIAQQVNKLKTTIDKHIDILGFVLPMNVMETIGEAFDLSYSNSILTDKNAYLRLNRDLEAHQQKTDLLDAELINAELIAKLTRPRRQVVGLEQGHLLLQSFIDRLDEGLEVWIDLNKQNKGGRPRKYAREYLLFWLVYHAKTLTGHNPPNSKTSWFVDFAKSVVELCGLNAEGIGASLPKIIRDVKAKKQERLNRA